MMMMMMNKDPPWKNSLIKDLEKRRRAAFDKNNATLVSELTITLKSETVKARNKHVEKLCMGSKQWWREANKSLKTSNNNLSPFLNNYASAQDAAEDYNKALVERFIETCPIEDHHRPTMCETTPCPVLSPDEVRLAICQMNPNSSPGPDLIPAWFIRCFSELLVEPLTFVFNLSLKTGRVPSHWRSAIICPLPKVKNASNVNDLRPISLTSVLSKLLERLVLGKLRYIWEFIYKDQFAYRPLSSPSSALTMIEHHWLSTLDSSPQTILRVLAVDFKKAFDSIES